MNNDDVQKFECLINKPDEHMRKILVVDYADYLKIDMQLTRVKIELKQLLAKKTVDEKLYDKAAPAQQVDRQTIIDVLLSVGNMSEGVIADAIIGAIGSQQVIHVPETKWNFPKLSQAQLDVINSQDPSTAVAASDCWQPMETAPLDGTKVDLWDMDGYRVPDARFKHHRFSNGEIVGEKSWGEGDRNWRGPIPIRWMRCPKPPMSPVTEANENTNEYGLDIGYMAGKLNLFLREINRHTPSEAARVLARLAKVADEKVLSEPEFVKPSPAVAVPDSDGLLPLSPHDHPDCQAMIWTYSEIDAIKEYARRCIASQSPRITEQDAREICWSFNFFRIQNYSDPLTMISTWFDQEGGALLNKLNANQHKGDLIVRGAQPTGEPATIDTSPLDGLLNAKLESNEIPTGWNITYNPKPIPDRSHDYDFVHDNYDGADGGNGLCGTAKSFYDAIAQIKEIELDNPESVGG